MKEFLSKSSVELRWQLLLGHGSVTLLSELPDGLFGSFMPLCALFLVSFTVGD